MCITVQIQDAVEKALLQQGVLSSSKVHSATSLTLTLHDKMFRHLAALVQLSMTSPTWLA